MLRRAKIGFFIEKMLRNENKKQCVVGIHVDYPWAKPRHKGVGFTEGTQPHDDVGRYGVPGMSHV